MTITNFRDIGGYETEDGRRVKKGIFYRSGPIMFQNDRDREEFAALGIRTILDLRSAGERAAQPDEVLPGCQYVASSAISEIGQEGGNFDLVQLIRQGGFDQLNAYVEKSYEAMPFANPAYMQLFDLMRQEETPLVFHCSAGKDRTGFGACLILKTLGVPDETIMEDYLLSNIYRREENSRILKQFPAAAQAEGLLNVQEKYLQSALHAIAGTYVCFQDYLLAEYGVTEREIAVFKARYLE